MCRGYRYSAIVILWMVIFKTVCPEASVCCNLANGSCRSACEKLPLVSAATNPDEFQRDLQKLTNLCPKTFMSTFWNCLNETLNDIHRGDGWVGRPCCRFPGSEKCRMACLQAQSVSDLSSSCRKSDEISFYTCLDRQEAGEKCCRDAKTINCSHVCREVFESSFTPSKEVRYAIKKHCSQEIQQCTHMYTHVTPADNAYRNLHCCEKSTNSQCRTNCRRILETEKIAEEIVDSLRKGGCGDPQVQDRLWQCFLANSKANVEPGGSVILSEKVGVDSAKLQCCFRAANVNCQRLCIEMFSHTWSTNAKDFDRICQYHLVESEMLRCFEEVDEPCELGCEGLSYCTNFNYRPTELFRNCNDAHDRAAQNDFKLWTEGIIDLPAVRIPVRNISDCHPEIWKAIACTLQIKPCFKDSHVSLICKSDCIDILTKCIDRKRLEPGETPYTLCEKLTPPDDTPCIHLSTYLAESNHGENALEVTHPCRPNRCGPDEVCMVNRNCQFEQPCLPHTCAPGCRMGDISLLVVPQNSFVRILSNTDGPKCHMVCHCNHRGVLEDCETQPCTSNEGCNVDGKKHDHNTHFKIDCNECFCYGGEVTCSKKQCGSGLPCNCPDHYVPVCGANGKTYPSACLARCAGLSDDDFEFGACYESDPCSPNSCHPYHHRCVPRKRVCLSIRHKSCKQYDCVDMRQRCSEQPKSPVCDTDNVEHLNICWLLQRRKTLAYYGKCMRHCRGHGPVCGHNGETYASECAAWAERVPVDYKGPCSTVGSSYGTHSRCNGIKCSPLPSEHCTKVFPPGGCCPICGAAIRVLYSQKLSDWSVEAVRDVEPVVVQTIANKLREHVKVTECEVFAYLSIESDIIVLFTAITDNPTLLQVEACVTEAEKVHILIHEHSPTLLTELPLSFATSATMIDPVEDGAKDCLPSISLLCVLLLTIITVQRIL